MVTHIRITCTEHGSHNVANIGNARILYPTSAYEPEEVNLNEAGEEPDLWWALDSSEYGCIEDDCDLTFEVVELP
jgi:hypothetical protein